MSWKEKRVITILSAILAVLFAAVLIVLSVRYRSAQADGGEQPTGTEGAAQMVQSDYVNLSYSNGSAYLAFAVDQAGAWYWENEPDFPLDDTSIRTVLSLLHTLKPQQMLDRPEDLSECGLDSPRATLTATTPDEAVLTIAMGNATTDGVSYYADINSDPDHIYIISNDLYQAIQTPIYEMCALPALPELTETRLYTVMLQGPAEQGTDEDGDPVEIHPTTILSASRTEGETLTTWRSSGANVTDTAEVRALLEDLAKLHLAECVDYRPSDEAAEFCGFGNATTLTVTYQNALGTDDTFVLHIGSQNMDGTGRYVRLGEETAIYLVELELLDPMMRIAYLGLE